MSEDIDVGQISEALNDKMDRDAGNPATLGKERIVGWGMPDLTRQTTLSVTTTPKQATYNMFVTMVSPAGSYLYVSNDSTYDINSDSKRRIGFINTAYNVYGCGMTVIAKGQWYYTNGTLNAVYACPFKGE